MPCAGRPTQTGHLSRGRLLALGLCDAKIGVCALDDRRTDKGCPFVGNGNCTVLGRGWWRRGQGDARDGGCPAAPGTRIRCPTTAQRGQEQPARLLADGICTTVSPSANTSCLHGPTDKAPDYGSGDWEFELPGGRFFSLAARAIFSLFSLVSLFFSRSLPPSGARISLEVAFSLFASFFSPTLPPSGA